MHNAHYPAQKPTARVLLGYGLAGGLATGVLAAAVLGIMHVIADEPDPAACKQAMRRQFVEGMRQPNGESSRPPECEGIDDATLDRLAGEVLREVVGDEMEKRFSG